jgi:DNA-binding IclR family transcriptional regulator
VHKPDSTAPTASVAAPGSNARDPNFVFALAKGLEVLAAFSGGELLGNHQLVERTGFPKATVSRLTSTLVKLGYLRVDSASGKLGMGTRLLGMGVSVQRDIGLHEIARPFMQRLSQETQLTVSFGTRDRLALVFLEVIRPLDPLRLVVNTDAGSVLPLPFTAIGLAYLVAAPVKERAQILQELRRRHADEWDRMRASIERAHEEYTHQGFVIAQRSWGRGISGVGVPLRLKAPHNALYAFHCAGPSNLLSAAYIKEVGPKLVTMIAEIAYAMENAPRVALKPLSTHDP